MSTYTIHKVHFHNPSFICSIIIDTRIAPFLPTHLPSQSHRTPTGPDGTYSFQIKHAGPDKGFGMFATRAIPAGALILVEHPAIITPTSLPLDTEAHTAVYHALSKALLPQDREELLTMANCRSKEECPTVEEGVARTNGTAINLPFPEEMVVDGLKNKDYGATFLKICRSNHSCGPNAALKWDNSTFASSFYALRSISTGEEITIIYTDVTQPRSKRQSHLYAHYGFHCACPHCSLPPHLSLASDLGRATLRDWKHTHPSYAKWWRDMCRGDDVVIKSNMDALEIVEREGMHGLQCLFIEEICLSWAVLGEEGEFRKWAQRLLGLSEVQDPGLASEVKGWLEDPEKRVKWWGWRKKQRLQMNNKNPAPPSPELYYSPLLLSPADY